MTTEGKSGHIRLTSHPGSRGPARFPLRWGAPTVAERGPVIATVNAGAHRNAIGAHGGSYSIYRALAISSGAMDPSARPDFQDTSPVCEIGLTSMGRSRQDRSSLPWPPFRQDFGHLIAEGIAIAPRSQPKPLTFRTQGAIAAGRLTVDNESCTRPATCRHANRHRSVWWLPVVAERFEVTERTCPAPLRRPGHVFRSSPPD